VSPTRGNLSRVNRGVAFSLALVWLGAGITGIVLGLSRGNVSLLVVALAAVVYAVLWIRVAARSRLLTWRELATPWRNE
jgi:hypothetical protein